MSANPKDIMSLCEMFVPTGVGSQDDANILVDVFIDKNNIIEGKLQQLSKEINRLHNENLKHQELIGRIGSREVKRQDRIDTILESSEKLHLVTFSDIASFTRLEDPESAIDQLYSQHKMLIKKTTSLILANTWGDCIMTIFSNPNEGLDYLSKLTAVVSKFDMTLRSGASYGSVKFIKNEVTDLVDVSGGAVYFAARFEPMADPGTILITTDLYGELLGDLKDSFFHTKKALEKNLYPLKKGDLQFCYQSKILI
jgi:hypothetical protein